MFFEKITGDDAKKTKGLTGIHALTKDFTKKVFKKTKVLKLFTHSVLQGTSPTLKY